MARSRHPNQPPPDTAEMKSLVVQRLAKEKDGLEKSGFLLSDSANFAWYPHLNRYVGRRTRRFRRRGPFRAGVRACAGRRRLRTHRQRRRRLIRRRRLLLYRCL